jgi:hypothetical protein
MRRIGVLMNRATDDLDGQTRQRFNMPYNNWAGTEDPPNRMAQNV